jgi:hypothetical protein
MKEYIIILISILFFGAISCDRPNCENRNPIFDKYNINSLEYKTELLTQIEKYGQDNFEYWLNDYIEENGKDYIIVNIQNDSLCAKCMIQVNSWNKIEGIRKTKGKGYNGAKLKGLTFSIA